MAPRTSRATRQLLRLLLLAAVASLTPALAAGQSQKLYKYRDESGAIVYSNKKPPEVKADEVRVFGVAPADAQAKEKLEKDKAALDETRAERTEQAGKTDAERERDATIKRNCEVAKENLKILESGSRVVDTGKDGRPFFLDEAQRQNKLDEARKQVEQFCGA